MSAQSSIPGTGDADERASLEALDWVTRRASGLSRTEELEFQRWLEGDAARRTAFRRWQDDWNTLDALPAAGLETLRANLAHDKRAAAAADRPPRGVSGSGSSVWSGWLPRIAMIAIVLAVTVVGWQAFDDWQQKPLFAEGWNTARGESLKLTLPDGSRLQLDTATRITATFFRERREVRLPDGEVLFEVSGDPARPFDVLAGPLRITVVGTRFSVRHTLGVSGDRGVHVAVEEGRVRVARLRVPGIPDDGATRISSEAVELNAGQQVGADAAGMLEPIAPVAATGIALWREGRISFNDVPLGHALAEFERYGSTGLEVRDAAVAALRLTGTFDLRRPDSFARVLPQVLPVRLVDRGGVTEISARTGR